MPSTVYIPRSYSCLDGSFHSQYRVYAMPYPMRPGQHPEDLAEKFKSQWKEVGLLATDWNSRIEGKNFKLICIERQYAHLKEELEFGYPGAFFEVEDPVKEG